MRAKRAQCSANRRGTAEEGSVAHRQGCIATSYVRKRMKLEHGKEPSAMQVFKRCHGDKDEKIIDARAVKVLEEVEKLKSDSETQDICPTEDELLFKAVGGWDKKGRVYGFGSAAADFFERPLVKKADIIQQLKKKCEEKDKEQAQMKQQIKNFQDTMALLLERMDDNCNSSVPRLHKDPPHDPSTGGGLIGA